MEKSNENDFLEIWKVLHKAKIADKLVWWILNTFLIRNALGHLNNDFFYTYISESWPYLSGLLHFFS